MILDETSNILHLYQHHVGRSEVPADYHTWCCLAGVAACVADRVFLERESGRVTVPNLYTFLLGPSGLGKDSALERIVQFVLPVRPANLYFGAITGQQLLAKLSGTPLQKKDKVLSKAKIFLVNTELAVTSGFGDQARSFITHLTELWSRLPAPLQKETVAGATAYIHNPCVNWLVASTMEWITDALPESSIKGGFIARIIPVIADYDLDLRLYDEPTRRRKKEQTAVEQELFARFAELGTVEGRFRMTKKARRIARHWYETRPTVTEKELQPTWKRLPELADKLAMILALCDDTRLIIRSYHVEAAHKLVASVASGATKILRAVSVNVTTRDMHIVKQLLVQYRTLSWNTLVRLCRERGVAMKRVEEAVHQLRTERAIERLDLRSRDNERLGYGFTIRANALSRLAERRRRV